MQTLRRIRRSIAAVLLMLYLPGCYRYVTPKGITPQEYVATMHPKEVRVTLTDGTSHIISRPWASRDSIGGLADSWVRDRGGVWVPREGLLWVAPLGSVQQLEARERNSTAAIVTSVVVVAAIATWGFASITVDKWREATGF